MDKESVKESFDMDTKDHTMEVVLDSGINRHLVFSNNGSFCYRFGIVTWDNHLCYYGDMGTFVFQRTEDMFAFFRSEEGKINPCYWHEKLESSDCRVGSKKYSQDLLRECVMSDVEAYEFDSKEDKDRTIEELESSVLAEEFEVEAHHAASDFESECGFKFSDFWENDLTQFTEHYIWACYAIVWGISEYDKRCKR